MAADRCRYGPIGAEFWSFSMVTLDWSQVKNIIGDIKVDIFFGLGGILPQKEGRKRPFLVLFDQNPKNQRFYAFTRKFLAMIFISFLLARVLNNLPNYTFKLFPGWALLIRSCICDFRYDLHLGHLEHLYFNQKSLWNVIFHSFIGLICTFHDPNHNLRDWSECQLEFLMTLVTLLSKD